MKDLCIENKIFELRGQRVMLDSDLAELYEVETKNLNKAVKRNSDRFPVDFMFQLTEEEFTNLRFPIWNLKLGRITLFTICIHRARSCHAFRNITFFHSCTGQYKHNESICQSKTIYRFI